MNRFGKVFIKAFSLENAHFQIKNLNIALRSIHNIERNRLFYGVFNAFIWLGWSNSAINPIIYYINREVRKLSLSSVSKISRPEKYF